MNQSKGVKAKLAQYRFKWKPLVAAKTPQGVTSLDDDLYNKLDNIAVRKRSINNNAFVLHHSTQHPRLDLCVSVVLWESSDHSVGLPSTSPKKDNIIYIYIYS